MQQPGFSGALDDTRAPIRARWVVTLLLIYAMLWLLVHGGSALVPPMDNIEQLIWVRKLAWGYYKHPPLTTLLLWPLVQLFGLHGWVTYVLGATLTLGALGLLWWQWQHGTDTIDYAMSTSVAAGEAGLRGIGGSLLWLVEQLLTRGILSGLLLGLGVWLWRRRSGARPLAVGVVSSQAKTPVSPAFFLLAWGGLPLLLMLLMGLLFGSVLQRHWGVAYLPACMAGAMLLARRIDWPAVLARPVLRVFIVLQALLMLQVVLTSSYGLSGFRNRAWRNFDAARVAVAMAPQVHQALGGTARVLIGPSKETGAISLNLPERPLVLLSNNYRWSPWVPQDLVARCGAVKIEVEYRNAVPLAPVAPSVVGGRVENLGGGITAVQWTVQVPQPDQPPCPAL